MATMAVITELVDAGLQLKRQGNLRGAIEHFRQLHATYPGNARIMFELAGTWSAFNVPEQALPLYQELLALPKGQGLPPKDMPRLYTRLGVTLLTLGDIHDALTIIDEGLRLHPSYRPLRVWRILVLSGSGADHLALLDALELMLESLAPSRWDIFEDDIVAAVKQMRAEHSTEEKQQPPDTKQAYAHQAGDRGADARKPDNDSNARLAVEISEIEEADEPTTVTVEEVAVTVKVKEPKKKPRKPRRKKQTKRSQLGKQAVRIDISGAGDAAEKKSDDDEPPAPASPLKIPVDAD